MPGFLENLEVRLAAIESTLTELAEAIRVQSRPLCPLLPEEEVWADGAFTVREACDFLNIKGTKLRDLWKSGELASAIDGVRFIAKRGCIRYLLAHQEHATAEAH